MQTKGATFCTEPVHCVILHNPIGVLVASGSLHALQHPTSHRGWRLAGLGPRALCGDECRCRGSRQLSGSVLSKAESLCTSRVACVCVCSSVRGLSFLVGVFCTRLLITAVHHHYLLLLINTTINTTTCALLRWNALQMCISQHFLNWVEFGVVPSREENFHLPHKSLLVGLFKNVRPVVSFFIFFLLCPMLCVCVYSCIQIHSAHW